MSTAGKTAGVASAPLVTIITPTRNGLPYIKEAVDSVLAQTHPHIEHIVVDGHSTDGTQEFLAPYVEKGQVVFMHEEGKGLAAARNTAIRRARGEFIAFLDADDIFMPEKIARQVAFFKEHPECGFSYTGVRSFYGEDKDHLLALQYRFYDGDEVLPELLKRNFIAPSMAMIRKSVATDVGVFDESFRRSEDWEYWLRLAYKGVGFGFIAEPLVWCRMHENSYSHAWSTKTEEKAYTVKVFESLAAMMTPADRERFGIARATFRVRLKLWYTYFGNWIPPLQWLYTWRQKSRFKPQ